MIATGVYEDFERNFLESEKDPNYGDFILISRAKWNVEKREGTMYIFSCSLRDGDSGIMTFVIPNFWEYENEANDVIKALAKSIKGKIVNHKPKRFIDE
jgi:hypothetical protein